MLLSPPPPPDGAVRLQVTISAADLKERTKKILSREVIYEDRHTVRDFSSTSSSSCLGPVFACILPPHGEVRAHASYRAGAWFWLDGVTVVCLVRLDAARRQAFHHSARVHQLEEERSQVPERRPQGPDQCEAYQGEVRSSTHPTSLPPCCLRFRTHTRPTPTSVEEGPAPPPPVNPRVVHLLSGRLARACRRFSRSIATVSRSGPHHPRNALPGMIVTTSRRHERRVPSSVLTMVAVWMNGRPIRKRPGPPPKPSQQTRARRRSTSSRSRSSLCRRGCMWSSCCVCAIASGSRSPPHAAFIASPPGGPGSCLPCLPPSGRRCYA